MNVVEIDPDCKDLLASAGLVTFDDFMRKQIGEPLDQGPARAMSRMKIGEQTFYLKRMPRQALGISIEMLVSRNKPHGTAYREMLHARALKRAGFDVMEIVGGGETRTFGIPGESFVISRAVPGTELDTVFRSAKPGIKREIAREFGTLLGRLHAAGFFSRVRLKDLMVSGGEAPADWIYNLIDRETRQPEAREFCRERAVSTLLATGLRHQKIGFDLNPWQIRSFLKGYTRALSATWSVTPLELMRLCKALPERSA